MVVLYGQALNQQAKINVCHIEKIERIQMTFAKCKDESRPLFVS